MYFSTILIASVAMTASAIVIDESAAFASHKSVHHATHALPVPQKVTAFSKPTAVPSLHIRQNAVFESQNALDILEEALATYTHPALVDRPHDGYSLVAATPISIPTSTSTLAPTTTSPPVTSAASNTAGGHIYSKTMACNADGDMGSYSSGATCIGLFWSA